MTRLTFLLIPFVLFLFVSSVAHTANSGFNLDESKARCLGHYSNSNELFRNEFKPSYNLLELEDEFDRIYTSKKRISFHSNYEPERDIFYLYYITSKSIIKIEIDENFIKSVTLHIETAIEKGYAGFVFLPDMGHSHLYFPTEHWKHKYANIDSSDNNFKELYEKMLADKQMKVLYHLSEYLKMIDENGQVIDDDKLNFKYLNRNFVGSNNGTDENAIYLTNNKNVYNTVHDIDGYMDWSAGFAVSASELGCFPYHDKYGNTRYFDISLYDPYSNPDNNTPD